MLFNRSGVALSTFFCLMCLCFAGCSDHGVSGTAPTGGTGITNRSPSIWVAAWADAPSDFSGGPGSELTVRELVKPSVGSRGMVRLHFSNFFGTAPVTLGAVHIGKQVSGASVTSDTAVTFGGARSVTIAAGQTVLSDAVSMNFSYGDVLSVTEYLQGSWANLTAHAQGVDTVTNYVSAKGSGDETGDLSGLSFQYKTPNTYLLDRVDVYGSYKETVATFGSSTTDGYHSGLDLHMSYPEQLAQLLHAAGRDDVAVANVGIAGTTVLGTEATSGVNRFSRDVLSLPGVTTVIDYLGANDLRINCVSAATLIAGKQNLISQAHAAGLKIYEGLTAPSDFCGAQNPNGFGTRFPEQSGEDKERFVLNGWQTATQSTTVEGAVFAAPGSDGVIDFNSAIVDPTNRSYMLPTFDSGDDIHPNDEGYSAMAKAIPLTIF